MNAKKIIIEARINEYTMREGNRHVPWTPQEIGDAAAACREAGASIVHFHARTDDGRPEFGWERYRDTIAAIRACSDILAYPTLGAHDRQASAQDRLGHILRLTRDGMAADFAPMDMNSTNADPWDAETGWFRGEERVYINSVATLRYFAQNLRAAGVKPQLVNWNLPMLRTTHAFIQAGLVAAPAYVYLGMSAASLAHHPPTTEGLAAYMPFLPKNGACEWTVALTGANLLPFVETIAAAGGHVATGLGDYAYRELGEPTNAEVVSEIVRRARDHGREPATPAQAMLGMN